MQPNTLAQTSTTNLKPAKKQPSEINNLFTALKTTHTLDERRAIERKELLSN